MNLSATFALSVKSLRYHKGRSFLTALGIIIGVTTVIAILALLEGLDRSIDKEFSALGANTIYVQKMELEFRVGRPRMDFDEISRRPDLTAEDAEAIARLPAVRTAVPVIHRDLGTLKRGVYEADDCSLVGIAEGGDVTGNWVVSAGRYITGNDGRRRSNVCVLGSYVAGNLFGNENPLNQTLELDGRRYVVVGTLEEKGASLGRPQDNQVFIPIETYLKYYSLPKGRHSVFHGISIEVLPNEGVPVETAVADVDELLRVRRGLRYYEENDFGLNTQASVLSSFNTIRAVLWLVMVTVASISLVVGGIGIMNIMLVSVAERTREIGIRKAVGARDRDVWAQFLLESVVLALSGGVVGIVFGLGGAGLVSAVTSLNAAVAWWTIALGFGFSATVGILFGIYPARRASRLNPIDAIRYE